jgi:hypothetical protein
MDFYEVVTQVVQLLQQQGRVTYRGLKLQFQLDDDTLEALKDELLFTHPVVDEAGRGLVWTGDPVGLVPDAQRATDTESRSPPLCLLSRAVPRPWRGETAEALS